MFIPNRLQFDQLSPIELTAIKTKNISYFQGIKNDDEIRKIVKSRTAAPYWGIGDSFLQSVLNTQGWEFCNFFITNEKWRTHIMAAFFFGEELNKPLFKQYFELALENQDNAPILGKIMNDSKDTPKKKEFLLELYELAKKNENESYMVLIESLFQELNEKKGDQKLYQALNKLNMWGGEKGLVKYIVDYTPSTEEPRYHPPSKILGIF